MDFAKNKLLDGPNELRPENVSGSLACLSIRFALEFNLDGTACDVARTQVERHMRLCIAATTGFGKMITISGSEPLLAEAAYELMKGTGTSAVCHLANHANLNCIHRGHRGELVAALLVMQAYDAARESSRRRWVSVVDFMEALLPVSVFETLLESVPTSCPMDDDNNMIFEARFEDYGMWFNHVIKIEDKELISIDHLWKFVVRGAMILCGTNQEGIDIILPVCDMKQNLGPDSVTAIIVQVKNTKDYKAKIRPDLFDVMNVIVKSIFSKDDSDSESNETRAQKRRRLAPKPVIRIVFALASPEPAVIFRARPEKRHHLGGLTTFDIWLAGLSNETFRQIQSQNLTHYKTLLECSLPHDPYAFELEDVPKIGNKAKKSRGALRRKMVPLAFPERAHHRIHQEEGLEKLGERSACRHPGSDSHRGQPETQHAASADSK
jgi:hypothetical protein